MITKTIKYLAAVGLAVGFVNAASAQPAGTTNYTWSGGGDKMTWSQPANWSTGIVPPNDGTTHAIFAENNGATPITIGASDVVKLNDALFGPTWGGETLNIHGSVTAGFGMFIWGDSSVTTLNLYTNSSLSCNDTIAFGVAWWFPGGPNVVMNVYDNAQVGVNWFQFGGHLNLFGGTVSVTNGLNTGAATTPVFGGGLDTDANRAINLAGPGKLVLPGGYTATVNDWLARGILMVYGVPGDAADIVIDEANPNWPGRTVVTTTATGPSPLLAVRIEVPRTNLWIGGLEQAQVFADYVVSTNVNVTTTSGIGIIYQSSNTNVVTVTAGGRVRATGLGSATLKVVVGTISNSVLMTVTAYTNNVSLVHRYSFAETTGTTAADSIGGPAWDGTLVNVGASFSGGQVVLDGVDGYVQLPAGILTNLDAVTIETWASFGAISNWATLFAFGDTDGTSGHNYITCQPHTGAAAVQTGIRNATTEQNPSFTPALDGYTNVHIVAVYHPSAGYLSIYTNGMLAAINSSIIITLADALSTGDPLNYIGHSLWIADPYLGASVNEFRIYNGPLTAGQIKADAALGPNQLIGTSTNTSLTITHSGGNLLIKWPTTSALVSLMSSPALGSGAVWTQVGPVPAVVSGNYQVTMPATGSAQFFRLQK